MKKRVLMLCLALVLSGIPQTCALADAVTAPSETSCDYTQDYLLPYSDSDYLKEADIADLTAKDLCYAINEIFARKGRIFTSTALRDYFTSKSWYLGTIEPEVFDTGCLSSVEMYNVMLLQAKQNGKGVYDPDSGVTEEAGMQPVTIAPETESVAAPTTEPSPVQEQAVLTVTTDPSFSTDTRKKASVSSVQASSTIDQMALYGKTVDSSAGMVCDGDVNTSWQEGVEGAGEGSTLTLTLAEDMEVSALTIYPGNWKAGYYEGNNRPKGLTVTIGRLTQTVELSDGQAMQVLKLSNPVSASSVTFRIDSVYAGTKWNDTCIAEIGIYGAEGSGSAAAVTTPQVTVTTTSEPSADGYDLSDPNVVAALQAAGQS